MLTEHEKLTALANLSMELNQVKDLDILMEHIWGNGTRLV
jgi:hypothetical protein